MALSTQTSAAGTNAQGLLDYINDQQTKMAAKQQQDLQRLAQMPDGPGRQALAESVKERDANIKKNEVFKTRLNQGEHPARVQMDMVNSRAYMIQNADRDRLEKQVANLPPAAPGAAVPLSPDIQRQIKQLQDQRDALQNDLNQTTGAAGDVNASDFLRYAASTPPSADEVNNRDRAVKLAELIVKKDAQIQSLQQQGQDLRLAPELDPQWQQANKQPDSPSADPSAKTSVRDSLRKAASSAKETIQAKLGLLNDDAKLKRVERQIENRQEHLTELTRQRDELVNDKKLPATHQEREQEIRKLQAQYDPTSQDPNKQIDIADRIDALKTANKLDDRIDKNEAKLGKLEVKKEAQQENMKMRAERKANANQYNQGQPVGMKTR